MIRVCLVTFLLLFVKQSFAQLDVDKMSSWQDSLERVGARLFATSVDPEKLQHNADFVKTLVSALKESFSYSYDFDGLDFVSKIKSPDDKFRIFSWAIALSDGSYLYYGAIQLRTADGSLKLVPLLDQTFEIANPDEEILSTDKWFGARYYDILPLAEGYILLGWKGHGATYTKKVIEPLVYDGSVFRLGAKVFSDNTAISRRIFNYTRQASMYLVYHPERSQIVFDHIVPADEGLEGNYRYYGPDLSFDAYELGSGRLVLRSDIEFQNPVRGDEDNFLDPTSVPRDRRSGL